MAKFRMGDKVVTITGVEGKVEFVDDSRKLVAVKATEDGVGHSEGDTKTYPQSQVRKR